MDNQQVWFITGASKGIGLELAIQLLQQGHHVAATSRNIDELREAVGTDQEQFLPLEMDLSNESSVGQAIQSTVSRFGKIDVVVNNAGYGQLGSLEELSDAEARANYEVNVFGLLNVIRQVMPQLRRQQSGHILNIASVAGITGNFPGWGIYCSTKFAVVGLSESLAAEVAEFGIKVTIVEPGYFRTNFLKSGSLRVPAEKIADYKAVRASEVYHDQKDNNQPGDPVKGAAAIIRIAAEANPPLHLLLGEDATELAAAKIKAFQDEMEQWKTLSVSTNFEEVN